MSVDLLAPRKRTAPGAPVAGTFVQEHCGFTRYRSYGWVTGIRTVTPATIAGGFLNRPQLAIGPGQSPRSRAAPVTPFDASPDIMTDGGLRVRKPRPVLTLVRTPLPHGSSSYHPFNRSRAES